MAAISKEDEELISKFVGLSTEDQQSPSILLPRNASNETDWSACLLLKVISNRTVIDSSFSSFMVKAWHADSETRITPLSKGVFMAQFVSNAEMLQVWLGGPWTYRGDIVAMRQVTGHADLSPGLFSTVEVWVQFYNMPVGALNEAGTELLGKHVGLLVSPPVEGFTRGRRFVKMKVIVTIKEHVKDRVRFGHPSLGEITVHCHYEKISRICCFCGLIGHEISNFPDHLRLSRIMQNPAVSAQSGMTNILKPKKGKWITDLSAIPKASLPTQQGPTKRSFQQTKESGPNQNLKRLQSGPSDNVEVMFDKPETSYEMDFDSSLPAKKPKPTGHNTSAIYI